MYPTASALCICTLHLHSAPALRAQADRGEKATRFWLKQKLRGNLAAAQLLESLKRVHIFSSMSEEELTSLRDAMSDATFEQGANIFEQACQVRMGLPYSGANHVGSFCART